MRKIFQKYLFLFLMCLISIKSLAAVNMRNASYTESWIDFIDPDDGIELKIERFYSSRSLFIGIFGFGWCTNLETQLEITSDGIINLTECGGGLEVTYYPENFDLKNTEQTIRQILDYHKNQKKLSTVDLANLKIQLESNTKLRFNYANQLHLVDTQKIKTQKNVFLAKAKGVEKLIFDGQNYDRKRMDGLTERFDNKGKLIQITYPSGQWVKLNYKGTQLSYLVDAKGRRLNFIYDMNGRLSKIHNGRGLESVYTFDVENLKSVLNMWSKKYVYTYDSAHNLTDVTFPDNTKIKMNYDINNDWIKSYINRRGCKETFAFSLSKDDPRNNYWGTYQRSCPKEDIITGRHEFWYKNYSFSQDKYLHRVLETMNKSLRDIYFHPFLGRPISVREDDTYTGYAYLLNGMVHKKEYKRYTPKMDIHEWSKSTYFYETTRLLLNEEQKNILNSQGKTLKLVKTVFEYDGRAQLTRAKVNNGSWVQVTFNEAGKLTSLKNNKGIELILSYAEGSNKPTSIQQKGLGDIKITYDNQGDIEKITNSASRQVSSSIINNFTEMLETLGPLGDFLAL